MSINVNMKKIVTWIVVVLIIVGSGFWWNSNKDERAADAEIETLIKFAQRQALEIAIIEQASKLGEYKRQIAAQQQKPDVAIPIPPELPVPVIDPKDLEK